MNECNARFRGSVGQLKPLSRPTDATVRNVSTGNLCTMLLYKASKIDFLITANFCHLHGLWLKGGLKMHLLQVECKSLSRLGAYPDFQLREAKLCNGGLGRRLHRGPGAKPLVKGQRDEVPLKLMTFSYFRD